MFEHTRCAGCHREHNEPSSLVQRDQRFCTDCHGELDRLKKDTELANVTDFSNDHPGFRLTLLEPFFAQQQTQWKPIRIESDARSTVSEHSSLQFSHKQHLDPKGIRSPDGDQLLGCDDCHRLNTSGREMLPIVMEEHCGSCHKLAIDENDPDKRVPHGDLAALYDTLKECFSLRYLEPLEQADALQLSEDMPRRPGGNKRALSKAEQKRALDWVDKQSLLVAQDIIEDRVCIDCHQISRIQGASGIEQWYVKPVVLNMQWMPFARFDHTSHASESCTNCHENADQSTTSSDILMPEIETCQECHGGENQPDKLVSDCVMCHRFHLPGRGLLDEKERATSIKESLDEMKNREVSAPSDTDKNH
ncbi:MAG TPA: hypothetical protein ENJ32_04720 [Crenotrichaceae bacterium]|nr:hypothetical protein [Crenotrichaceae bacterium]